MGGARSCMGAAKNKELSVGIEIDSKGRMIMRERWVCLKIII